jgi:endoglucanase
LVGDRPTDRLGTERTIHPNLSDHSTTANYDQALYLSLLFLEAQRAGPLPPNNRVPWRRDAALADQGEAGEDLTGGYFDGPSFQKVMLPAAWTTTVLAWGVMEFGEAYRAAGEHENVLAALRWSYDYMVRGWVSSLEL